MSENLDLFAVKRPYVPYSWLLYQDYLGNLNFDLVLYWALISAAQLQLIDDKKGVDGQKSLFEVFYDLYGSESEYAQAYCHLFTANAHRFRVVLSELGFVDYVVLLSNGDVEVHTLEKGYNKIEQFKNMIEGSLDFIPVVVKNKSEDNPAMFLFEEKTTVAVLQGYYVCIKKLWAIEEQKGYIPDLKVTADGKLILDNLPMKQEDKKEINAVFKLFCMLTLIMMLLNVFLAVLLSKLC